MVGNFPLVRSQFLSLSDGGDWIARSVLAFCTIDKPFWHLRCKSVFCARALPNVKFHDVHFCFPVKNNETWSAFWLQFVGPTSLPVSTFVVVFVTSVYFSRLTAVLPSPGLGDVARNFS